MGVRLRWLWHRWLRQREFWFREVIWLQVDPEGQGDFGWRSGSGNEKDPNSRFDDGHALDWCDGIGSKLGSGNHTRLCNDGRTTDGWDGVVSWDCRARSVRRRDDGLAADGRRNGWGVGGWV